MKLPKMLLWSVFAFVALFAGFFAMSSRHRGEPVSGILSAPVWQRMVTPGELSGSHAFLENNCAACHTPVKGVEAQNCVVCHVDNETLLQRQPTAFHASITECASCHLEHQGRVPTTTRMDHVALAHIASKQVQGKPALTSVDLVQIMRRIAENNGAPPAIPAHLQPGEEQLNCAACHQTKDRHNGQFGNDCAACHATSQWTIAEFRHPAASSQSCAQCHQAPPSHYMMHFNMVSMKVAGQEHAEVSQCFLCHQTTSWNDIKGVGWYKHH